MRRGLKEKIEKLSENPGVYIFKDENENILYIGKAKNLKKRVKQYFQRRQKWPKTCLTWHVKHIKQTLNCQKCTYLIQDLDQICGKEMKMGVK